MKKELLRVEQLRKYFPVTGGIFKRKTGDVRAVDGVSFSILQGETMGFVGESGCGKTTLGRTIAGIYKPSAGRIFFENKDLLKLSKKEFRLFRRNIQVIFQDPFESLNPRFSVRDIIAEPFEIQTKMSRSEIEREVVRLIEITGLSKNSIDKFPHEFSGGQRQRIGIARAIALNPKLIICDEPVSALDVSIQSQIINLLMELQERLKLTYLFIAHDLAVVKHISDKIAVMYLGQIVESGDSEEIYKNPVHPYTKALISAIPSADFESCKERIILKGDVPSPASPPPGCRFSTRCPFVMEICRKEEPELKMIAEKTDEHKNHLAACHL